MCRFFVVSTSGWDFKSESQYAQKMKIHQLDTTSTSHWKAVGVKLALESNLICLTKPEYEQQDDSPLQWFGTNVIQEIAVRGNTEICPLYGEQIKTIDDFCYQLCRSLPWGHEMGRSLNAVYDVLLNFETMPKNRVFIWYDCQILLKTDRTLFKDIFEMMVVAGYLNTIGESTHDYQVNQKNTFLFRDTQLEELTELLEGEYYTPRLSGTGERSMKHEFQILEIQ